MRLPVTEGAKGMAAKVDSSLRSAEDRPRIPSTGTRPATLSTHVDVRGMLPSSGQHAPRETRQGTQLHVSTGRRTSVQSAEASRGRTPAASGKPRTPSSDRSRGADAGSGLPTSDGGRGGGGGRTDHGRGFAEDGNRRKGEVVPGVPIRNGNPDLPGGPMLVRPERHGGVAYDSSTVRMRFLPDGSRQFLGGRKLTRDQALDAYAGEFWRDRAPGTRAAMESNIKSSTSPDGSGKITVGVNMNAQRRPELTHEDRARLAAYHRLAESMGFDVGSYRITSDATALATLTRRQPAAS